MTKLEELTALMVNEINDFKNGVEKLERINDQIKGTKIKMDLSEYRTMIYSHKNEMKSYLDSIERFESRFNYKLERAKIYPNWAVIVFIVCIVVTVVLVLFMLRKLL